MTKEKKVKEPTVTKEPKEKKAKEVFDFYVAIASSGETYEKEGNDLYELLRGFPMPALVNTETNIVVTKGDKTIQRDLKVADARRCFTGFDTTSLELLAISITKQLPN